MRKALTILATSLMTLAAPVWAQSTTVVELFTSQGCSSCPPADKLMHELAQDENVIALALHVDYWDYIGWKDAFARPDHTRRQKAYARSAGSRTIYTPQMVIGGTDHVIGNRPSEVAAQLAQHMMRDLPVEVSARRDGTASHILVSAQGRTPDRMVVQVVTYMPSATVEITRGENAGKTMRYVNIVTSWRNLREWDGQSPLELQAEMPNEDPAVVIVQEWGHGPILAAARVN